MRFSLQWVGAVCLAVAGSQLLAGDWTGFRGPSGNGISSEKKVPLKWSATDHVKWKAPLPQPGNSSPTVTGDRVFITCAEDSGGTQRSLYCLNRNDGSVRWVKTIDFGKRMPTHKTNPYCATTAATDGKRVVVWHGSAGLFCYDLDGNQLWARDLGEFRHQWGYAGSPVIYKDRVFLNCGPGATIFMGCFDLESGADRWRTEEPQEGDGQKRPDGAPTGSWATPVVVRVGNADQLLCSMPTRVVAYNVDSGDIIWYCEGLRSRKGNLAYSSPVIGKDMAIALGGYSGAGMGFRLGGRGNVTQSNQLWRSEPIPQSIGSGVIVDGYFYVPDAGPGTIRCLNAMTGDVVWTDRAAGDNHWGSIILAEGRCYVTNQSGKTVVFKPNPGRFELLATNSLDDSSNSTPAISNGQIFIRTDGHLWCIE